MNWKHWIPLLGLSLTGCSVAGKAPLELVDELDLERDQGTGYEIAKFPNRFRDPCVAATRAEYTPLDDGTVEAVNRDRRSTGDEDAVRGRARRSDSDRPAAVEVRFAPARLPGLPAVRGDDRVPAQDEGDRSVPAGEPSQGFPWNLSRTPTRSRARIDELLAEAERQGFASARIDFTLQEEP